MELGYALSSEEHAPADLVTNAREAEDAGFTFALISDHYHPWIGHQGHSPFVWTVIGAIARETTRLRLGTGVTCPTVRIHPAIIAQAAATCAAMMPGRFFLGVGTGENLNEHILGGRWPRTAVRARMLEEAIEIIRELWRGEMMSFEGDFYEVENARLFTLPDEAPPIYVAASGPGVAALAARAGDGLISTAPTADVPRAFSDAGGSDKPKIGQMTVCWAPSETDARSIARQWWPNAAIRGELGQELPTPEHFEQAAEMVSEADVAERVVCGPDPAAHLAKIDAYVRAGYDAVYVHQVGPDQRGFFDFYRREIMPKM